MSGEYGDGSGYGHRISTTLGMKAARMYREGRNVVQIAEAIDRAPATVRASLIKLRAAPWAAAAPRITQGEAVGRIMRVLLGPEGAQGLTYDGLAERSGYARATMVQVTRVAMREGLVERSGWRPNVGRPGQALVIWRAVAGARGMTCRTCERVSYDPNDLREGWCPACQRWTTSPVARTTRLT